MLNPSAQGDPWQRHASFYDTTPESCDDCRLVPGHGMALCRYHSLLDVLKECRATERQHHAEEVRRLTEQLSEAQHDIAVYRSKRAPLVAHVKRLEAKLGERRMVAGEVLYPGCHDCGEPYPFPLDMVLPDEEWHALCPEGGLLCANCIIARASGFNSAILVHARIVHLSAHDAFVALKNVPLGDVMNWSLDLFKARREIEETQAQLTALTARYETLKGAAQQAIENRGCNDGDCCEAAFAQTAALEALRATLLTATPAPEPEKP